MASQSSTWHSIQPAVMAKKPSPNMGDNGDYSVMTLRFEVPLDHVDPLRETLTLHAELPNQDAAVPYHRSRKPLSPSWNAILRRNKPYILYLCGGPGDGNKHLRIPGLNKFALERGYQVLYVDYRGTGKSQPVVDASTISRFRTAAAQAEYISFFRQDNIARDLEAIRLCLANSSNPRPRPKPKHHPPPGGDLKWTIIGQSFGGWIALTYLSFLPTSLSAIYLTAGLAPITKSPTEVYTALYRRVIARNEDYYRLYPGDAPLVRAIATHIFHHGPKGREDDNDTTTTNPATLGRYYPLPPSDPLSRGRLLTAQSFLTLGRVFGDDAAQPTGFERVHRLVQCMASDLDLTGVLSRDALAMYAHRSVESFRLHRRPLYAVLHEAIYLHGSDGPGAKPSAWAALRAGLAAHPGFSWLRDGDFSGDGGGRLFFSGEMIFPFMLATGGDEVRAFGDAAEVLSLKRDWERLYDLERLGGNREVRVRAMAFESDMYVDFGVSRETGGLVGSCEVVRGEDGWGHGALKEGGKTGAVLGRLFGEE
ncbi:Alpha/Beta hydrolase protein [Cercophora scortea]|uniref:Alpha/Beta hydrolase protein n=1 Tax=Cercophora scortea TaxID=314031 RepID=A0AAE0IX66_9PEZI|nr:Alpha/Beta hydrolase protein [Cercophora scortea]